jgi:fatty acid desaturase
LSGERLVRSRSSKEKRERARPERHDQPAIDQSPSLFSMVRIVAITVALIILVSFAAGYGFGRLFL